MQDTLEMTDERKRKGNMNCCVVGCSNTFGNSSGLHFYKFPNERWHAERKKMWINAIRRVNLDGTPWSPKKHTTICSTHFINGEKVDNPASPSYCPTIFPNQYKSKEAVTSIVQRCPKQLVVQKVTFSVINEDITKKTNVLGQEPVVNRVVEERNNSAYSNWIGRYRLPVEGQFPQQNVVQLDNVAPLIQSLPVDANPRLQLATNELTKQGQTNCLLDETVGLRRSKINCCVVGCSNSYANTDNNVHFYSFPNERWHADRKRKWIAAVKRVNYDGTPWIPKRHTTICSTHFANGEKVDNPSSLSYCPTIFPDQYKLAGTTITEPHKQLPRNRKHLLVGESTTINSDYPKTVWKESSNSNVLGHHPTPEKSDCVHPNWNSRCLFPVLLLKRDRANVREEADTATDNVEITFEGQHMGKCSNGPTNCENTWDIMFTLEILDSSLNL